MAWIWLRISAGFKFWLSFTKILVGFCWISLRFGRSSAGFRLGLGWIWLRISTFRLLLLRFFVILASHELS